MLQQSIYRSRARSARQPYRNEVIRRRAGIVPAFRAESRSVTTEHSERAHTYTYIKHTVLAGPGRVTLCDFQEWDPPLPPGLFSAISRLCQFGATKCQSSFRFQIACPVTGREENLVGQGGLHGPLWKIISAPRPRIIVSPNNQRPPPSREIPLRQ